MLRKRKKRYNWTKYKRSPMKHRIKSKLDAVRKKKWKSKLNFVSLLITNRVLFCCNKFDCSSTQLRSFICIPTPTVWSQIAVVVTGSLISKSCKRQWNYSFPTNHCLSSCGRYQLNEQISIPFLSFHKMKTKK